MNGEERSREIAAAGRGRRGERAGRRARQHWPRYLGPNYMLWNFSRITVIWLHWASRSTDRQRNYNTVTHTLDEVGGTQGRRSLRRRKLKRVR